MAIVIPNLCSPPPFTTNGAKWWKSGCRSSLVINYPGSYYSSARCVIMSVDGLGSSYKAYKYNGSSETVCTNPSGYTSAYSSGEYFGITVDIWGALDDSAWTSSTAFTVKLNSNGIGGNAVAPRAWAMEQSGVLTSIATTTTLGAFNAANDCSITPANNWTCTVYDDGSITIA